MGKLVRCIKTLSSALASHFSELKAVTETLTNGTGLVAEEP